jgi:hypothetical protein
MLAVWFKVRSVFYDFFAAAGSVDGETVVLRAAGCRFFMDGAGPD